MKDFTKRVEKLEKLLRYKNEPMTELILEKEKIDPYYWSKMFELFSNDELIEISNLGEDQQSVEKLKRFILFYESEALKIVLSTEKKARIDMVDSLLDSYPEPVRDEIVENKTEFAKNFWNDIFNRFPISDKELNDKY